jgi:hypothetical protein
MNLTLSYWRRTPVQGFASVGGRRCRVASIGGRLLQHDVGDGRHRPLLLLEGRVDEEVGDGESAAAA